MSFQWHWNDFISPLIYLQSRENFTVSLGLRMFQSVAGIGGVPKDNLLMAASVMALLPSSSCLSSCRNTSCGASL